MPPATHSPEIEQQSIDQLTSLTHRLRQAHARAKDISARQQREILGKADPRGPSACRTMQVPWEKCGCYLKQFSALTGSFLAAKRMSRGRLARPSFLAIALELKTSSQTSERPDPGRSASEGMDPKKRKALFKVGTTRKEIGRVSQAGKVAQTRKDSKG
jgi:hypothetical protein